MEYRCKNAASQGSKTCPECSKKIIGYKYQASPLCDHGLIGGPYPKGSDLYNSPDYLTLLKQGWKIRPFDEVRAKEAVKRALSEDMPTKKTKSTTTDSTTEVKKPKRALKLKAKPEQANEQPVIREEIKVTPTIVESVSTPLVTTEVLILRVRKQRVQGKEYYICSQNDKMYTVTKDGPGTYVGRFIAAADCDSTPTIDTSYPDSDIE